MSDPSFSLAGLKAALTLLVLMAVFGFLIHDAWRNRPDRPPPDRPPLDRSPRE
ncbi:hypothetical protein BH23GEM11_BH23GEM11_13000 [soil metagenome]